MTIHKSLSMRVFPASAVAMFDDPAKLQEPQSFYRAGTRGHVHATFRCHKRTEAGREVSLTIADLANVRVCDACFWATSQGASDLYYAVKIAESVQGCEALPRALGSMSPAEASSWLDWVGDHRATVRKSDEQSLSAARSRALEALEAAAQQITAHLAGTRSATQLRCAADLLSVRRGRGWDPSVGVLAKDAGIRMGHYLEDAYYTWRTVRPAGMAQARAEVLREFEASCRLKDLVQLHGIQLPADHHGQGALEAVSSAWQAQVRRDLLAGLDDWEAEFALTVAASEEITVLVNRPASTLRDDVLGVLRAFSPCRSATDRYAVNLPQVVAWWLAGQNAMLTVVAPALTGAQLETACALWDPSHPGSYQDFTSAAEAARLV